MANLNLISDLFDKAETRYRLTSMSSDTESHRTSCIPTGQLMLDACLNGGLPSGRWITVYGGEGSAKSTTMQTFMHAFGRLGIPGSYFDFEGSSDPQYLTQIIRTISQVRAYESEGTDVVTKLFGLRGKNGKWVERPLYRLYTEGVGDTFFNMLAEILRLLPDKVFVDGKWYLVYKEKPSDAKVDRNLSSRGAYYVEEPNGYPQMAEIIDSYPFMFPERLDTEDAGAGMAAVARMFSENIPKVAGKLRRKGVIILGVNQTRLNPGVRYGCFQHSSRVVMADGTTRLIGDLVAKRDPGPVLSYNPKTQTYEAKPIVDWYINGQTQDEWLKFTCSGAVGRGASITFKCTPNHKLMSADGTLHSAGSYSAGDYLMVASENYAMNDVQTQIILGSVLGDGAWKGDRDELGCALVINHRRNQHAYTKWKAKILADYLVSRRIGENFSEIQTCALREDWFVAIHEEARQKGHRMAFSPTLFAKLDLIGLAIWYMDDAAKSRSRLKLQSYTRDDALLIAQTLNDKFGGVTFQEWKDVHSKACNGRGWGLKFENSLMEKIAPYIHEYYKDFVPAGAPWRDLIGTQTAVLTEHGCVSTNRKYSYAARIQSITDWSCYRGWGNSAGLHYDDPNKYDIQVEGNHLYCVDGVVVHNSPEYEPGGQAVRFVSSVRIKNAARSVPHGKGAIETEPSVLLEGDDQYKYILTQLTKNKTSTSLGVEFWQRLWAADPNGEAYGFDPVWDAWEFLGRTGQRSGTLKTSSLRILSADGASVLYEKDKFSLADLKHLMLLEGKDRVDYAKSMKMDKDTFKGLFASGKLHSHLHSQIVGGAAQTLVYQTLNGVVSGLEENDEEDMGDDDGVDEI